MRTAIVKTVVGSLPRFADSLELSIKKAVDIQLRHNIDIVSDGEQRSDMIGYFEQIPGLIRSGRRVGIVGRICRPNHVGDFYKLKDFAFARRYLKEVGMEHIALKVGLTGPITLGFTCAMTQLKSYKSVADLELYRDLASALQPLIDELLRLGAYVQIDEPGLSGQFLDPTQAVAVINEAIADLKHVEKGGGRLSAHVCGNLTRTPRLFDLLTRLNVDVLSLAFGGPVERRNLKLVSSDAFINSGKRLGFGCLSVASRTIDSIESVEEVVRLLSEGVRKISFEKLAYIHPNCGFRETPLDVVEEILKRMEDSAKQL